MIPGLIRSIVYPAPGVRVPSPPPDPLLEEWLEVDGDRISTWWMPPPAEGDAPVVLMFHGNGENLETMRRAGLFDSFGALGTGVLAVDYPGYGRSDGRPGQKAILAAGSEALRRARELGRRHPLVVAGWSLGAAVAVQLAAREEIDGVVLMSPWNRLRDVASAHFPDWIVAAVLDDRYDSLEAAEGLRCPSLVLHGTGDRIIPVRLGRELADVLPEPTRWIEVEGAGHNDLLGRDEVWREIGSFLAEIREAAEEEDAG